MATIKDYKKRVRFLAFAAVTTVIAAIAIAIVANAAAVERVEVASPAETFDKPAVVARPEEERARSWEEKKLRYTKIFESLESGKDWSIKRSKALTDSIKAYAIEHDGNPEIEFLECRADIICKLVLAYKNKLAAMNATPDIQRERMFFWPGRQFSTAADPNGTDLPRQQIYLISEDYRFDGWNLVKKDEASQQRKRDDVETAHNQRNQ